MQNPLLRVLWLTTAIAEYRLQVSARVSRELRPGRIVIADRYLADFIVDQELNVGLAPSDVSPLYHYPVMRTFPSPDLTVVLDLDPVTAASRKSDGTTAEYLRRRREHYLAIGAGSHAAVVDASLSADVVHAKILSLVTARLGEAIR
jgi:thymidylate kinase